jgi:hypothetical protein
MAERGNSKINAPSKDVSAGKISWKKATTRAYIGKYQSPPLEGDCKD